MKTAFQAPKNLVQSLIVGGALLWTALGPVAFCADTAAKVATPAKVTTPVKVAAPATGTTAVISTTMGDITVKLFPEAAPKTVANFIGLSTGSKEWTDPKTQKTVKGKSLYAGTIFHRVIPEFMIQGGDPLGTGTGGPGYQFEDEFSPVIGFDRPGLLAMANAGPATNGSQFFITVKATPWLNRHHTIFGEVTSGMAVVEKIVNAPRGDMDRPKKEIKILKISIR